jgi:hypothetical protein
VSGNPLWEGESKSLTSAATKGKVVTARYRITDQYIFVETGILSSKAEQIPLWAIRDIDLSSSIIQKARGLSTVRVRVEDNDFTGAKDVVLENIDAGNEVRDLLNKHANDARLLRQQQAQSVHYTGATPIGVSVASASPHSTSAIDPIEQLTKLGGLLQAGLLTQEEFDTQKAKLLAL